ncbi:lysylphosphatidylglycerol synthase transmembrane domain-containing protein [Anaeromyxobacter oryzisoli]|uniref:lysylphosphatidylglycerol synthase transmembrane domain-containing protein n=1 Tax=Anaeromyxobacter oryzisoli TaxID=2925408 RepID=UPI001F5A13F0|nr:lysylphosphatidylglycerol synthase transmembrane domain-containing protein [Anaeromyxobacter sp. SG63]
MSGRLARLEALGQPPPDRRRRRALRLLGLGVVAAFAALAARHVDLRGVLTVLARADVGLVLLACGANVLSLALHSKRWASVVQPPGARLRFRDAFAAVTAGFAAGVVLPARAGDVLRAALLARRARLSTASLLAAAALDYVVGSAALVPLLALVAVAMPLPAWARTALLVFAGVAGAGLVAAFALRPTHRATAEPATAPGERRVGLVARLRSGLSAAHDPGALTRSFAWGLGGWLAEVLIALLSLAALGLPATLPNAVLAVVASTAANVVAVSPGNTGPFELAVVVALSGLGVDRESAVAFALVYHLAHLAPVTLIGGGLLIAEARREGPAGGDALPGP